MTRVAALYDIHANLTALDAVLADAAAADLIVVGGDFAHGPLPAETVDRLRGLGDRVRFIRGNADREVGGEDAWQREPLGEERLRFLAVFPRPSRWTWTASGASSSATGRREATRRSSRR